MIKLVYLSACQYTSEAIALAVAINAVLDFFMTPAGLACLQVQVTLAANRVGMLDENKLKRIGS